MNNKETGLIPSVSIANLVNQRAAVLAKIDQALDLMCEAEQIASRANLGFPTVEVEIHTPKHGSRIRLTGLFADRTKFDSREAFANVVDATGWNYLMNESGLRTFMDEQARKKWSEQISDKDVPELSAENVITVFEQLHESRNEMFERGVINIFQSLSWSYKTNQPCKFGKRIILSCLFRVYKSGSGNWLSVENRRANHLDDLDRVFHLLDNKPEPDHRNGWYGKVNDAYKRKENLIESEYFNVKWFQNGNGHIIFNAPHLVDRMNLILAKHFPNALPDMHA